MARRGRVIDLKQWSSMTGASQSISSAGTRLASGVLAFLEPGTILRCRTPDILMMFDATQQIGDTINLTFGLALVSADAAAAGATSMPDPGSEPEFPWLWWGDFFLRSELAAGEQDLGSAVVRRSADTKAMRRFKPGQALVWVVEATAVAGAPVTLIDVCRTRVLIGT